jgi:hypothetical protein
MLARLLLLLFLSAPLAAEVTSARLKELCAQQRWAEAEGLVRVAIASHEEPTDLEGIAQNRELLRQPGWPQLEAAYFARLDEAAAARAGDLPYEFLCRGIKEQWARFRVTATDGDFAPVTALDDQNTARLKEVVAARGWPRKSEWGERPALSAWLIVQHSPDSEFQASMLPLIEQRMQEGELGGSYFALLYDRVRLHQGRAQRYGSQVRKRADGTWEPVPPLEEPERLDALRASVGLQPIADYLRSVARMYDKPAARGWFH